MKNTYKVQCSICESTNIYVKGDAMFNVKTQQWDFNPLPDYSAVCGSDTCKDERYSTGEVVKLNSREKCMAIIKTVIDPDSGLFEDIEHYMKEAKHEI